MEIKDFISVYDDVMALSTTGNFLKFCNKISFAEQKVLTPLNENRLDKLDKKTRSTKGYGLRTDGESLTEAHWCNVYSYLIEQIFRNYDRNLPFKSGIQRIDEINVLKYEKDDFYVAHTDSFLTIPRTLSIVIFLNTYVFYRFYNVFEHVVLEPITTPLYNIFSVFKQEMSVLR